MQGGMAFRVAFLSAVVGLTHLACVGGCRSRAESKPREESHIKVLGLLYGQYVGQHMGRPPQDEQTFRAFVQRQEAFLKQFRLESADQVFQSERDGEPYTVVYGDLSKTGQFLGGPVVAWEKKGVGGRRYVVNSLGAVKEVTEEEFKQLVPAGQ